MTPYPTSEIISAILASVLFGFIYFWPVITTCYGLRRARKVLNQPITPEQISGSAGPYQQQP
jgi:hypothetical protein